MGDSNSAKPGSRPGAPSSGSTTPARGDKPDAPADDTLAGRSGRVVHDERGNAVWRWVKETSRSAIDSTSHLLKRLEVPELKVEDSDDNPLSLEADRDPGGGYDPYGSSSPAKPFAGKAGPGANRAGPGQGGGPASGGRPGQGSGPGSSSRGPGRGVGNPGGGYDPYGKGVTRKPGRKP
jgi:hypothetical protein